MSKEKKEARAAHEAKVAELETLVRGAVDAEGQTRDFTAAEAERKGELNIEIRTAEDHVNAIKASEKAARKELVAAAARSQWGYTASPYDTNSDGGSIKVDLEHRQYERGNGESFLRDTAIVGFPAAAVQGWGEAWNRLQRHAMENHVEAMALDSKGPSMRTDKESYFLKQMLEAKNVRGAGRGPAYSYRALSITSGAGGEFVPPLFQTEDWIAFMRAARPFADCQRHMDLPDGTMSINIPKVTGGTAVGPQSGGENTPVLEVDLTTDYVTFPVVVKAGQQLISLQLLERSPVAFDQIVYQDLAKAYAQAVDVACLSGNGSNTFQLTNASSTDVVGLLNTTGVNVITWSSTSDFIPGLYGQLGQAKSDIANTYFSPATHCFLTPTIWEYIASQFDATGRPLVVPEYNGPFNAAILNTDQAVAQGALGRRISGLSTFEDANLPQSISSNQSVVVLGAFNENYLFESPVITRALPQTYGSQLAVLLQCYGYIAYTASRYPNAQAVITGGALATPTFQS